MRRLRSETGTAVVVAIALMAIMMSIGLAAFATVDTQQRQSGRERIGESSFNLSEAALNTQAFVLSRNWPGTAGGAYPTSCTNASTSSLCPSQAQLASTYRQVDFASGFSWTSSIRDNGGTNPNYYDDAVVSAQPSWDANGDDRVWVRSQATVRGKLRTLVALVRVEVMIENFPRYGLLAGKFSTNNNGNKTIVDTKGRPLVVRCRGNGNPACLNYRPGQIRPPDAVQQGYTGGNALAADAIDRLRTKAIASGTYYASGCPSSPTGAVVYVENGNCSWTTGAGNSPTNPGMLIIANGTLYTGGNFSYYGIVYMLNRQNSSANLVTMRGTSLIQGAVAVDGDGGVEAGASKMNIIFDELPFSNLRSYGTAGIVQNTWREL